MPDSVRQRGVGFALGSSRLKKKKKGYWAKVDIEQLQLAQNNVSCITTPKIILNTTSSCEIVPNQTTWSLPKSLEKASREGLDITFLSK